MSLPTIDSESFLFYSTISNCINSGGRSDDETHINEDDNMELSDLKSPSTSILSESENDE